MSKSFGKRLREARMNTKKTQEDMADILGLSYTTYGAWERGTNEPSLTNLTKICEHLCVSADWLLGLDAHNDISHKLNAMTEEMTQAQESLKRMIERMNEMRKGI